MLQQCSERSNQLLVLMLGRAYTLADVAYYAAGLLGCMACAWLPGMHRACLPLLLLLGACLAFERCLPVLFHDCLEADSASGKVRHPVCIHAFICVIIEKL